MKKTFLGILFVGLLASSACKVEAKVCSCLPVSKTTAAVGAAGVGCLGGRMVYALSTVFERRFLKKIKFREVIKKFEKESTENFSDRLLDLKDMQYSFMPKIKIQANANVLKNKLALFFMGTAAITSGYIGWKFFSRWTANGYVKRCASIVNGNCCEPALLNVVKLNIGKPEQVVDFVLDVFNVYSNELAISVFALDKLTEDIFLARDYLEAAERTLSKKEIERLLVLEETINSVLMTIKNAKKIIKNRDEYKEQSCEELQKRRDETERKKYKAIKTAGYLIALSR
ncbi:hypothetical protein KAH94_02770 [bacterium]|nr:hypothetical protein [bacterium]